MSTIQFWVLRNEILQQVERKTAKETFGEFQLVDINGSVLENDQNTRPTDDDHSSNASEVTMLSEILSALLYFLLPSI